MRMRRNFLSENLEGEGVFFYYHLSSGNVIITSLGSGRLGQGMSCYFEFLCMYGRFALCNVFFVMKKETH